MSELESGKSISVWMDTFEVPKFNSLDKNIECDVCIVGGGITGLTTAYLLALEGKSVTIIDDGEIGGGETGSTTAHITAVIDDRFSDIESLHGEESTRLATQSQLAAIKTIEENIKRENISCDFKKVDGYLFFTSDDVSLEEEYEAIIKTGLKVEKIDSPLNSFKDFGCLKFSDQAQFHILKYISGLAEAIVRLKGKIFTKTFVTEIEDKDSVTIKTESGFTINSKDAVIATNSPISDFFSIHTKQSAYRSYVIGIKTKKNSVTHALYWDTEDPYHYVRVHPEESYDILIIGGEDHKTGQEDDPDVRFKRLEIWAKEKFGNLGQVIYKWSGQIMEPVDGLSFIGKDPENSHHVYIATGDSGMGMTHGTFSGLILRDLIMGRKNEWSDLYDPNRITLKAFSEFAKEGVNFISQYLDLLTPGEIKEINELSKGEGNILREGLDKIAVYKDESGKVYCYSALCPHLKCVLQWNSLEKSWDCPCHGSRFEATGKVINGPAIVDMKEL